MSLREKISQIRKRLLNDNLKANREQRNQEIRDMYSGSVANRKDLDLFMLNFAKKHGFEVRIPYRLTDGVLLCGVFLKERQVSSVSLRASLIDLSLIDSLPAVEAFMLEAFRAAVLEPGDKQGEV